VTSKSHKHKKSGGAFMPSLLKAETVAIFLRMRMIINRMRSTDRNISHLEHKELADVTRGDIGSIKKDFADSLGAIRSESDRILTLYHDLNLLAKTKIDTHLENAVSFIQGLEAKGFPKKDTAELISAVEAEIAYFARELGVTEGEAERVKNFTKEVGSKAGALRRAA
jgi:hypothetical protein